MISLRTLANRFLVALFVLDLSFIGLCARVAVVTAKREQERATARAFDTIFAGNEAAWQSLIQHGGRQELKRHLDALNTSGPINFSLFEGKEPPEAGSIVGGKFCHGFTIGERSDVWVQMCAERAPFGKATLNLIVSLIASQIVLLIAVTVAIYYWVVQSLIVPLAELAPSEMERSSRAATKGGWLVPLELVQVSELLHELWAAKHAAAGQAALAKLSAQVAHDIRSPIAALDVVVGLSGDLAEDHRILIRSAVERIRDIANTLLDQRRPRATGISDYVHLIPDLVEQVVYEKRVQNHRQQGIEIFTSFSEGSWQAFARVDSKEFKRVVSNLLNNAAEAIRGVGNIEVKVRRRGETLILEINDEGAGIDPELAERLSSGEQITTKATGNGLGFAHARETVESWGGEISIRPRSEGGTQVQLLFPALGVPEWFAAEIAIEDERTVVIVDDDESIHRVWDTRLNNSGAKLNVRHFFSAHEFKEWAQYNSQECLLLCDYELRGSEETGVDVIKKLGIVKKSILITSHSTESELKRRCIELGLRMIPKTLAPYVPLKINGVIR